MCTAISFVTKDHYFGRNLDLDHHYEEAVTVMPRNYPLYFRLTAAQIRHYAMVGIATIDNGYPLYYDATNEYGLSMAGLNFPENAVYLPTADCAINIAPFELIPWVLSQCKTVKDACHRLQEVRVANIAYSEHFKPTPLHWLLSDSANSVVLEPMDSKLQIYENPIGVLTNNPVFPFHAENLRQYLNLTRYTPKNGFSQSLNLHPFSGGLGAIGLPGDFSSASRFVRAAFVKENSVCDDSELSSVMQFFHILQSVQQPNGCNKTTKGYQKTIYSSCCNTAKGIYYYTTYEDNQVHAVHMHHVDLDGNDLAAYKLINNPTIDHMN